MEKLPQSKRNNQQNEKTSYGMGKNVDKLSEMG